MSAFVAGIPAKGQESLSVKSRHSGLFQYQGNALADFFIPETCVTEIAHFSTEIRL